MADLNKKALAETIAEEQGLTKKAASEVVDLVLDEMTKALKKGNTVDLSGFGKFTVKAVKARTGINPATGDKIKIAATKKVAFKPAKALKETVAHKK